MKRRQLCRLGSAALALVVGLTIPGAGVTMAQEAGLDLPDGYVHDLVLHPAPAGPLAVSHGGAVHMHHAAEAGGVTISRLDVAAGTHSAVLDVPPWLSAGQLLGGPADTFFLEVGGNLRQVRPDGSFTVWNTAPLAGMPVAYDALGRMIGIGHGGTTVVELHQDGSATTLLTGLEMAYDVAVAPDGTIYVSDFPAEKLIELATDGTSRVVTAIAPDNTDLAIDGRGDLYLNNAAVGFARVDVATGQLTPATAPLAPCRAIRSPADFVFDGSGRALFFAWVESLVTWANPTTGEGGRVITPTWANTTAADLGPDDALYVAVSGCGATEPTRVVRGTVAGGTSVRASGPVGDANGLAVTAAGGVYLSASTETSTGLYYSGPGKALLTLVPGSAGRDIGALADDPRSGHVLAYLGPDQGTPGAIRIAEFSTTGPIAEHVVALPEAATEVLLDIAPDGTVYAYASEAARYFTGPTVKRWLLRLDLASGTSTIVSRHDRVGCCPFGSFAADFEGDLWWVLNPDFILNRVAPDGTSELFATGVPVDTGYANRTQDGDILLNAPEGLHRIWQPTLAERIGLVDDKVRQLESYGALGAGQGRALSAKLSAAKAAAASGRDVATGNIVRAFLGAVRAYIRGGILDAAPADLLVGATKDLVLPNL